VRTSGQSARMFCGPRLDVQICSIRHIYRREPPTRRQGESTWTQTN
jgi:hypothetical protein